MNPLEEPTMDKESFSETTSTNPPLKPTNNEGWKDVDWEKTADPGTSERTTKMTEIKDPLEAIDALEDALEEVREALPMRFDSPGGEDSPITSPRPRHENAPLSPPQSLAERNTNLAASKKVSASVTSQRSNGSKPRLYPMAPRPAFNARVPPNSKQGQRPIVRPNQTLASRTSITGKSTEPRPSTPKAAGTKSQKENRLSTASLSTSRPAFIPAKSTKPLTRSTFELPGEAISRRMRAQREERLKKEEEEREQRKLFKASKIRYSHIPAEVRETFTSRSRASRGGTESPLKVPSRTTSIARAPVPRSSLSSSVRTASIDGMSLTHSASDEHLGRRASFAPGDTRHSSVSSGPTARSVNNAASGAGINEGKARHSTVTSKTPSMTDTPLPKLRGKAVLGRDRQLVEDREHGRRQKEEATRRARAEAAERGRLASREWAEKEKQKVKARQSLVA
ncbi:hypothetical protein LOZ57_004747 [Ophidiomyces ophidiicola]|uniref:uncharacterized protein n=1 Tax=Ophidiomyces ophidiicola TaxID=1387563 RepID=UPI0020C1F5A0|nr:uncharacterized protein LOZ57_004747 [Ophidiomyces ophidiicola]KAI1944734.1 hypothetical protein LOZ57_004747 [Ophidiomyces ophidiicola]KAI2057884.1 hypothetical protein LOZ43_002915 [Ophidiomyces ophidiicola]